MTDDLKKRIEDIIDATINIDNIKSDGDTKYILSCLVEEILEEIGRTITRD